MFKGAVEGLTTAKNEKVQSLYIPAIKFIG